MSRDFYYLDPVTGGAIVPVADGDFFTKRMSADYGIAEQSSIEFYSDAAGENKVTPTAGLVTITGTPDDDGSYLTMAEGTFSAADSYLADRARPNAINKMVRSKLTLSGVTGAAYFKAFMWRSN